MRISVITPSIRPRGLEVTFNTLKDQTFTDFEWLPRLSIPGQKPDLCKQMNAALREAKGELVVFLQDFITIEDEGLQKMWDFYKANPTAAWTSPVGKVLKLDADPIKWDWRYYVKSTEREVDYQRWEIDWGAAPLRLIHDAGNFDEEYDSGFGWENVDLGARMAKIGTRFLVDTSNAAVAIDHDKLMHHPFKHKANQDLWIVKKQFIDPSPEPYDEDSGH